MQESVGYQRVLRATHDLLIMRVRRKVPMLYRSHTQIRDLELGEVRWIYLFFATEDHTNYRPRESGTIGMI